MSQSTIEERRRQRQIRQEKKKRLNKVLRIVFIVVVIITLGIVAFSIFSDKTYQNEEEFQKYAEEYLAEAKPTQEVGEMKALVQYGQPLSAAIEYPVISQDNANSQIQTIVEKMHQDFEQENSGASKEDKKALLVGYDSYKTEKEAVSVVLHQETQEQKEKKMQTVNTAAYAYNFSTKTGRILSSTQIFENDYREFCSKYMTGYFQEQYGDKLIKGKYKKALANKAENFNNFSLSKDGVTFYFEQGTVVAPEEGSIAVKVDYKELDGVIRDEISERALDPNKPMVALTYDDGPYPQSTNRILDCLEENGAVATFFELGQNVSNYPEVLKREKELGMEIGSHSWSHPNLNTLSASAIKNQLDKTNDAIKKATGQTATVFRPPYGNSNSDVEKFAQVPVVLWSVDTLDWKSRNADSVEAVVKGVKDLDGRVILMHSIYDSSAEATERLVPWLLDKGYQLVTVSELLEYKYGDTARKGLYGYNYFYLDKEK